MALAAVGDVFQVTLLGSIHTQRTMNTFYYIITTMPGGATVKNAADALDVAFTGQLQLYNNVARICPSNWSLNQVWMQRIIPTRTVKDTYDKAIPGGSLNASTVSNVSCSLTRRAETADRHSIGGVRICLSPADCVGGALDAGTLLKLQDLAAALPTPQTPPGGWIFTPGFIRKIILPQPTLIFQRLFSCTANFTSRVVRRRTVGLGI